MSVRIKCTVCGKDAFYLVDNKSLCQEHYQQEVDFNKITRKIIEPSIPGSVFNTIKDSQIEFKGVENRIVEFYKEIKDAGIPECIVNELTREFGLAVVKYWCSFIPVVTFEGKQ